ncbi:hypothetical protein, partial [Chryseobacterium sp. CCH4-E10]|uniref:hypothetical protein n=1 Tax=Chryseobacterium sp. CCH4-E10 TaxID=1768758 RepID=UPI001E292B0D
VAVTLLILVQSSGVRIPVGLHNRRNDIISPVFIYSILNENYYWQFTFSVNSFRNLLTSQP